MSTTHLARGCAGYRRATVALFCAGFATFAMLYCVQPLLAAHFRISAASSSLALTLTTLSLALCLLISGALAESWGRKPVMAGALRGVCSGLASVQCRFKEGWLVLPPVASERIPSPATAAQASGAGHCRHRLGMALTGWP